MKLDLVKDLYDQSVYNCMLNEHPTRAWLFEKELIEATVKECAKVMSQDLGEDLCKIMFEHLELKRQYEL